ncbi:MAG TPA: Maf family protein [Bacteroidia bacterium]|nr:Maf family protein [Bacteroidia bacterium]HRH07778.1 Maf family protein [Bacteroidia bacterium]HRH63237.1 Maf family protein [Bacteroidia bacterium]
MKLNYHCILASKSPRRHQLLNVLGVDFSVKTKEIDESFPLNLVAQEIPLYLSEIKSQCFEEELQQPHNLIITADTIVWINNKVLNKPDNFDEAVSMLEVLSGNMHQVFTAVCLKSQKKTHSFYTTTNVYFKKHSLEQIQQYVNVYKPYDKAGAYGAQECLPEGMNPCSKKEIDFLTKLGKLSIIESSKTKRDVLVPPLEVEKIEGSYFNVMGLPLVELADELTNF